MPNVTLVQYYRDKLAEMDADRVSRTQANSEAFMQCLCNGEQYEYRQTEIDEEYRRARDYYTRKLAEVSA
jgi:hypothetical protein